MKNNFFIASETESFQRVIKSARSAYFIFICFTPLFVAPMAFAQSAPSPQTKFPVDIRTAEFVWHDHIAELGDKAKILLDTNDTLSSDKDRIAGEIKQLEEQMDHFNKEKDRLVGEPSRINPLIASKQEKINSLHKDFGVVSRELTALQQAKGALESQTAGSINERKFLEEQRESLSRKKIDLESQKEMTNSAREKEKQGLLAQREDLKTRLDQNKVNKAGLIQKLSEAKQQDSVLTGEM